MEIYEVKEKVEINNYKGIRDKVKFINWLCSKDGILNDEGEQDND